MIKYIIRPLLVILCGILILFSNPKVSDDTGLLICILFAWTLEPLISEVVDDFLKK